MSVDNAEETGIGCCMGIQPETGQGGPEHGHGAAPAFAKILPVTTEWRL